MKIKSRGALAISVRDILTISARRRGVGGRDEGEKEEEKEEEEHACRFVLTSYPTEGGGKTETIDLGLDIYRD